MVWRALRDWRGVAIVRGRRSLSKTCIEKYTLLVHRIMRPLAFHLILCDCLEDLQRVYAIDSKTLLTRIHSPS